MKNRIFLLAVVLLALAACKSEQKIAYYADIYEEKPTTIYLVPIEDLSYHPVERTQTQKEYNQELDVAAHYLYTKLSDPLTQRGYYAVGPVASELMAPQTKLDSAAYAALRNKALTRYEREYGVDAILITTIHRWHQKNNEWCAYLEFHLRSTKTGKDLMHHYVKAQKFLPQNHKGFPIPLRQDRELEKAMGLDSSTVQRCILLEKAAEYVLMDLPIHFSRPQYDDEKYFTAEPNFSCFIWNEEWHSEIEKFTLEEFEHEIHVPTPKEPMPLEEDEENNQTNTQ